MKVTKSSIYGATGKVVNVWPAQRLGEFFDSAAAPSQAALGYETYQRYSRTTVIESPDDFLADGIAQIVNSAAETFSYRGDGISQLVNAAIQIVEESYVTLPREDCFGQYLDGIAECAIQFLKAPSVKEERSAVLQLGNALDDLGATLNIFFGEVAQTANLKLRVLSRLLLINSMRPLLDNTNKNEEIDFQRLSRISIHRQK